MGRPRTYQSPEAMEAAIDEYFENETQPTVSGLALALGIDRITLLRYEGRPEFTEIVGHAKRRIEVEVEKILLYGNKGAGPIFNLKNNFGWRDQQDVNIGNQADNPFTMVIK